MSEPTPHPNAEVIKAWADGLTVQSYNQGYSDSWMDWRTEESPPFGNKLLQWRIKPVQKTGWINIYPSIVIGDWKPDNDYYGVWPTKETADMHSRENRIAIIQITYTEGEGL